MFDRANMYAAVRCWDSAPPAQYSSGDNSFTSNLRFRLEYQPGSEFFAVYTDERDTLGAGLHDLKNRAVIVKINRLVRF